MSIRTAGQQHNRRSSAEPWKIKMVEPLNRIRRPERQQALAEAVKAVYDRSKEARGPRMTYEPKYLRFFQARFEQI